MNGHFLIRAGAAFVLAAMALAFSSQPALAATYYVSPLGSDSNPCTTAQSTTQANAKLTIQGGVACLSPGDLLYLRGGTYTGYSNYIDSQTFTVPTGKAGNPITIAGYPSETVTIQPPAFINAIRFASNPVSYWVIQDLIIDMVNNSGNGPGFGGPDTIYISDGTHDIFKRLEIKNNGASGMQFSAHNMDSGYHQVLNCHIHDNGLDSRSSNSGYGIYGATSHNIMDGNDVHDNHGYGIHFNGTAVNNNIIRNNRVHDNYPWGTGGNGGVTGGGIAVMGEAPVVSNQIYNNIVYHNGFYPLNPSVGAYGILIYSNAQNTLVANNTVYQNNYNGIALQYDHGGNIVRNNIAYANTDTNIMDYTGAGNTLDHNLCNTGCTVNADPLFTNAASNDFTLPPGSPGIDAGAPVGAVTTDIVGTARPQGSAYDVGAFETAVGAASAPQPPQNLRATN